MWMVILKWEIIAISLENRGSVQRDCNKQWNLKTFKRYSKPLSLENRGSVQRDCNKQLNLKILVVCHNLKNYEAHLIM